MSFSVSRLKRNGLDIISLQDHTGGSNVEILPAFGGLLYAFTISKNGQAINIIDNYPDREMVVKQLPVFFKSAKLSPFVCRIKDGKYHYNGKNYIIQKRTANGEAIHGLLYDQEFEIKSVKATDELAEVILSHQYDGTDAGYPFAYVCEICYQLFGGNELRVITTVKNISTKAIPIADGWHYYFRTGCPVDELAMEFAAKAMIGFNEQLIPDGRLLPYNRFDQLARIGNIEMDNSFLLAEEKRYCKLYDENNNMLIEIMPDVSYPILQIFIPPDRESIAIENLSAAPDTFNNGIGLILLEAGASKEFSTTIRVSSGN